MAPNINNLKTQSSDQSEATALASAEAQGQSPEVAQAELSQSIAKAHEPEIEHAQALSGHDQDQSQVQGQTQGAAKAKAQEHDLAKEQEQASGLEQAQGLDKGQEQAQSGDKGGYQDDEDDYGIAPKKISYEQALELSKQQQGLVSVISMLQVIVICVFMAGFIGYVKADGVIKELALNQGNLSELQARLAELCGAFSEQGAIGAALWFMLSSLVGGVALLIPIAIYNVIARSADRSGGKSAGVTLYDVIRAEVLKYALMIIILALAFKFTALNALVIMATFVIVMFSQIIKSAISLGRG